MPDYSVNQLLKDLLVRFHLLSRQKKNKDGDREDLSNETGC